MIGVIIIAHGKLGESLIHCAHHVLGAQPPLLTHLEVTTNDKPEKLIPKAQQLVVELNQGAGVLVLSDIYGATPCNVACRVLQPGRVEGIAGVNLPMLVRVLSYRNEPLHVVVAKATEGGIAGVVHFTKEACEGHP